MKSQIDNVCLSGLYPYSMHCNVLLKFRSPWKMNPCFLQPVLVTWIQFNQALCKLMKASGPLFPPSLLEVFLEDFCEVENSHCNAPGPTEISSFSCQFNVKKVKLCSETQRIVRVSLTQVCFGERQESQNINSWYKRTFSALWLCTWYS